MSVSSVERAPLRERLRTWLADHPDDMILRFIFRAFLALTIAALASDLATMNGWIAKPHDEAPLAEPAAWPAVPAILAPLLPGADRRLSPMPQPDARLARPMTFQLTGGGRLIATGTITPGVSEIFAEEVNKRGDYIKTVVLNSPGGSVSDALAMGRLIREKRYATEIEAEKYCASSCPLMFVGGAERKVGEKAAVGVHQVFSMSSSENTPIRDDMSDAQRISAKCQRYLGDMGVNLQMWVHAMETPKDKLFVFKPEELKALNIVSATAEPASPVLPPAAPPSAGKSRL